MTKCGLLLKAGWDKLAVRATGASVLKPERLASYLPGASLFSFPIALRSSNPLTNKQRGREEGAEGWRERWRKGGADQDFSCNTTMQPVDMKT